MDRIDLQSRGIGPTITVKDLQASIRFYTEGLGFTIADRYETDGVLTFMMLRAGDASLGLGQDDFAKGRDRVKGVGVRLWVPTEQDIHALAAQAQAAGITLNSEVMPLPWGPLAFELTDPDGFVLTVHNG